MRHKIRTKLLILLDILLINISICISYLIRFDFSFWSIPEEFHNSFFEILLIATVIKIICFLAFKLYNSLWQYAGIFELVTIVLVSFVSNAIVISYIFISRIYIPRSIFIIAFLVDIFLVGGVRFAYRVFRRIRLKQIGSFGNYKRILIIGGSDAGAAIIKELKAHHELMSKPIAIIDDDKYKVGKLINGVPIVGTRNDILHVIEDLKISEVIIALPKASNRDINEIYSECSKTYCKVKILPSMSELIDESVVK